MWGIVGGDIFCMIYYGKVTQRINSSLDGLTVKRISWRPYQRAGFAPRCIRIGGRPNPSRECVVWAELAWVLVIRKVHYISGIMSEDPPVVHCANWANVGWDRY